MRSGFTHNFYAEHYVERFTVTLYSEKLVTIHNVSLCIRDDLGPSLLHASLAELPTHNNRVNGTIRVTTLKWELSIGPVSSKNMVDGGVDCLHQCETRFVTWCDKTPPSPSPLYDSFRRYSLKILTLNVTLTMRTAIKNCHKTLWLLLLMMHHHTMFNNDYYIYTAH